MARTLNTAICLIKNMPLRALEPGVLILAVVLNFTIFAPSITLYLDDVPYLTNYRFNISDHGLLSLMKYDNAFYIDQGRFQPISAILRYPVVYAFFGESTIGYHLFSNILHIINVLLVMLLSYRLSGNRRLAFTSALLFAIYPHNKEGLIQFNSNGGILETVFFLAAVLAFIRYASSRSLKAWACATVMFLACVWTYEQAYPLFLFFPFLLVVIRGLRRTRLWSLAMATVPFLACSLGTNFAQHVLVANYQASLILDPLRIAERAVIAAQIAIGHILVVGLFDDRVRSWSTPEQMALTTFFAAIILVSTVATAAIWIRSSEAWHSPPDGLVSTSDLVILGVVLIGLGYSFMIVRDGVSPLSRHYYLPAIGLAFIHASAIESVLRTVRAHLTSWAKVADVLSAAAIGLFALGASLFNVQRGMAVSAWSNRANTIKSQMENLCPSLSSTAVDIGLLGDVREDTGWIFSDGGKYFPQLWFGRKSLQGRLIYGDERFVPDVDGFYWNEIGLSPKFNYDTLVLFDYQSGTILPINELHLHDKAGHQYAVSLPSSCKDRNATYVKDLALRASMNR